MELCGMCGKSWPGCACLRHALREQMGFCDTDIQVVMFYAQELTRACERLERISNAADDTQLLVKAREMLAAVETRMVKP